jgi:hypothetical protein
MSETKMTCVTTKPAVRERLRADLAIARIQWRRRFGVGIIDDGSKLSARIDHLVAALGEKTKADTNA